MVAIDEPTESGKCPALIAYNHTTAMRRLLEGLIYIGGLLEERETSSALAAEAQAVFDTAVSGVVLFSMDTVAGTLGAESDTMGTKLKQELLAAMARFPQYQFIWKMELRASARAGERELLANATNVHTFKWLEQRATQPHASSSPTVG